MDRSQFAAVAVQTESHEREAPQAQTPGEASLPPAAPQVLDERMLAQVVGGLPRVGGW